MIKQKQSLITDDTEPAKDYIWNKVSSIGKSLGHYKYMICFKEFQKKNIIH